MPAPITELATRTTTAGPAFESRQGRKPRESGAVLSAGAMEISLAAAVRVGSGREALVQIVGARRRRVGELMARIEEMVG